MAVNYGSLPFAEALEYLRAKLNLPTQAWDDLLGAAHDRAFVVAGATAADLLMDLRAAVEKAIAQGTTLQTFRQDFARIVAERGWTGWTGEGTKGGRAWRTRVIYETNLFTSYSAGRVQQMKAVANARPYWRYRHSDASVVPRPEHVAWDGLILRHDDPWWAAHTPPNGFGCKCFIETLSEREMKKQGLKVTQDADIPFNGEVQGVNPKTGEEYTRPEGVDRGWDYQPGRSYADDLARLKKIQAEKDAALRAPRPKSTADLFHLDDFEQIGPQTGSNLGGLYRNKFTGETYYVKFPNTADHVDNEVLAGKLYELAGVQTAKVGRLVGADGKIGVASKVIDGLKSAGKDIKKAKGAKEGFAVDAWLANWDAVGLNYDNLLIDASGSAVRIDAGGSLLFRAQGGRKGAAFGAKVNELLTLRDPRMNPQAAAVFGDLSDAALKRSLKKVTVLKDADIDRLVDAYGPAAEREFLKATLKARRDDLKQVLADLSKPKPKAGDRLPVDADALKRMLGHEWDEALRSPVRRAIAKKYKLTDDEVAAVFAYSRNWYTDMNSVLRQQMPETPELRNLINACINGAVRADPFRGEVKRGVAKHRLTRLGLHDLFEEAHGTKGNYVRWNGFTSSSDAAKVGQFYGEYQLTVLDARGGRIQKLSQYDTAENEVLLPPGSIMVVENVDKSGPIWRITVRMVDAAPDGVRLYEL
ncbi:MAG: phage minor head protein [Candidatus Contendobacter sp.]|nr:phage minor head protein [Candidatus Contendobacter sp.]